MTNPMLQQLFQAVQHAEQTPLPNTSPFTGGRIPPQMMPVVPELAPSPIPSPITVEELPPPLPPAPPPPEQESRRVEAQPARRDLSSMLEEIVLQSLRGGGNTTFTPQMITPDMLPNWQAVRDAMAAAAPREPEQISDNERWNNALMAFLGNFSWRPGERIGSSLARQGGAAAGQSMADRQTNRQIRDVFRREQQAHRMAQAQTEMQAQVGQANALMQMIQANNAAQIAAMQAGNMAEARRLQAAGLLLRRIAEQGQVSPEYVLSRLVERVSDPRTPFNIPGLDYEAARQRVIASLPRTQQQIIANSSSINQVLQAQINRAIARDLMEQFTRLPRERQIEILMQYRPLVTQRPRANATLEEMLYE